MLVLLFQGRPIKKREALRGNRLRLTFFGSTGEVGERRIITQAEWERHGNGDGEYVPEITTLEQLRQRYVRN